MFLVVLFLLFFFNDTATTEIYTLSLHDALPILALLGGEFLAERQRHFFPLAAEGLAEDLAVAGDLPESICRAGGEDRKSTRLNSSHGYISYAVFCLKKKKKKNNTV